MVFSILEIFTLFLVEFKNTLLITKLAKSISLAITFFENFLNLLATTPVPEKISTNVPIFVEVF